MCMLTRSVRRGSASSYRANKTRGTAAARAGPGRKTKATEADPAGVASDGEDDVQDVKREYSRRL
jgi:hypothetical protein